jgi:hypothetical protein
MQLERLNNVLAAWSVGAIAGPELAYEILMLAGEGNAAELFSRLPADVQTVIRETVAEPPRPRSGLFELVGGTYTVDDPDAHAVEVAKRLDLVHAGHRALHNVVRRTPAD